MKTTIEISDELLRRAQQAALERDTTLRAIVEEALERALGGPVADAAPLRTVTWPPPGARTKLRSSDDVLAAIARERDRAAEDPRYLSRRLGLPTPPGRPGKRDK